MCVVNITLRPLYSRERTHVLIKWGAGWATKSVCTFGRRKKLLSLSGLELRTVQTVAWIDQSSVLYRNN
jgi:hypothetical protein